MTSLQKPLAVPTNIKYNLIPYMLPNHWLRKGCTLCFSDTVTQMIKSLATFLTTKQKQNKLLPSIHVMTENKSQP